MKLPVIIRQQFILCLITRGFIRLKDVLTNGRSRPYVGSRLAAAKRGDVSNGILAAMMRQLEIGQRKFWEVIYAYPCELTPDERGALVAAKLALFSAMRVQSITKVELASRLGISESAVRRLANPDHRSHISQMQKAL